MPDTKRYGAPAIRPLALSVRVTTLVISPQPQRTGCPRRPGRPWPAAAWLCAPLPRRRPTDGSGTGTNPSAPLRYNHPAPPISWGDPKHPSHSREPSAFPHAMSCQPTGGGCTHEASPSKQVATTRAHELSGNCGLPMRRLRPLTCRVLVEIVRDRDNLPRERQTRETLRGRDSYCGVRVSRAAIASPPQAPPAAGVCRQVPPFQGGQRRIHLGAGRGTPAPDSQHHGRCTRRRRIGHDRVNRVATRTLASRMPGKIASAAV